MEDVAVYSGGRPAATRRMDAVDHGVDGFRMDVINAISKVPGLPDALEFARSPEDVAAAQAAWPGFDALRPALAAMLGG